MNKHISKETLQDFFREIGEMEEISALANRKLTNTCKPLTAAACKGSYGASQKAKA